MFCSISFEPRDIWIGVYWNRMTDDECSVLHIYICLVPMVPIHFSLYSIAF
jgi:hypothetical protein